MLSDEQRRWTPTTLAEAYGCWPAVWKVEMFDGALQFSSAGDPKWDWRSVAMAARAYPGWRIALHDGFLLSAVPPEREAGTRRTS